VALLVPAPRANGGAVAAVLERWKGRLGVDDAFEAAYGRRAGHPASSTGTRGATDPATGVIVAAVRGRLDLGAFRDQDDIAVPAPAVAEYLTRVELDVAASARATGRVLLTTNTRAGFDDLPDVYRRYVTP